jgi:hypothetical protein
MRPALKYTLKVWLTSVCVSPVIITLYESLRLKSMSASDDAVFVIFAIIFGGIFSMPCAVLLWLTTHGVLKTSLNNEAQKTVLTFIGAALTGLPVVLINGNLSLNNAIGYMTTLYAITIVAGIWIYRLQPQTDDVLQD